jgi:hypothetical protein
VLPPVAATPQSSQVDDLPLLPGARNQAIAHGNSIQERGLKVGEVPAGEPGAVWPPGAGVAARRCRLVPRLAHGAPVGAGGWPPYSDQPAQPIWSLSRPANMDAFWEI